MAKTTTVTTIKETDGSNSAEPLPRYKQPFLEIIAGLTPEDWQQHKVRIYRADESWGNPISLEGNVFQAPFDEDTIRAKWGGGRYLLWLFGPPDAKKVVVSPFRLHLDGAPKAVPGHSNGASSDVLAMLQMMMEELRASRGGDLTQTAMKGALQLQAEGLKSGVQTVRELNPTGEQKKTRLDELFEKFMETKIMEMMNGGPAKDPFRDKLETAMLEKLLNPADPLTKAKEILTAVKDLLPGGGSGKTDVAALANTFLNNLPSLADRAVSGMKEYRLASEAQERTFRLQNDGRVIDMPASPHAPGAAGTPASAAAAPPASSPVEDVHGPTIEWVQLRIVDAIEKNAEAAGEWLYDFLEAVAPEVNLQIGGYSPEQLMALFESQTILQRVAKHPQLPKVIERYLADAKAAATVKPS